MSNICDFDRILKTDYYLEHCTRNCRINNFHDFERDEADAYFWRAGLLNVKGKGMTICYIMNRCLVIFLRGGIANVMQIWWNIVAKLKVNKWSLFSNQNPKILILYQDNYFVVSLKLNFCERQTHCIDDQDKFQSILEILTMNSLNVKHQGKSSNQLAFHLSAYTHLWKL